MEENMNLFHEKHRNMVIREELLLWFFWTQTSLLLTFLDDVTLESRQIKTISFET